MRRAQEIAILNTPVSAERARSLGVITRVVSDDQFEKEGARVVAQLSQSATSAIGQGGGFCLRAAIRALKRTRSRSESGRRVDPAAAWR
jgi:enoyl-CoA hydratase/carnithine racemase